MYLLDRIMISDFVSTIEFARLLGKISVAPYNVDDSRVWWAYKFSVKYRESSEARGRLMTHWDTL